MNEPRDEEAPVSVRRDLLDPPIAMLATGLRDELDLDRFGAAGNTSRAGALKRVLGRVLAPFAGLALRRMGARMSGGTRDDSK